MTDQPRLAVIRKACRYGGFSRSTVYRLIESGKIEAHKMGRRTMIDLESIDRYHKTLPKVHKAASR